MQHYAVRVGRDHTVLRCPRTDVDLARVTPVDKTYGGEVAIQVAHAGEIRERARRFRRALGDEDLTGRLLWNLQQGLRYR